MAITFWRNVQRKITTQEMDASFDTLVNDIANAGLSAEMPEGQIYIGDNTNNASLKTLDTSIVPETTDKRYQSDLQDTYNDATSSIQTQLNNKLNLSGNNANQDIDIDGFGVNAKHFKVNGTAGAGHIGLKHQSANISASASESSIGADSVGDPVWKNDGGAIDKLELQSNKTGTVTGNEASTSKYLTVKGVYDWAVALFAPKASPTFTGTVTTPDIVVSGATASTIAHFDGTKNIESLPLATYPSLTELSYVKGVTSAIQTQLDNATEIAYETWSTDAPYTTINTTAKRLVILQTGVLTAPRLLRLNNTASAIIGQEVIVVVMGTITAVNCINVSGWDKINVAFNSISITSRFSQTLLTYNGGGGWVTGQQYGINGVSIAQGITDRRAIVIANDTQNRFVGVVDGVSGWSNENNGGTFFLQNYDGTDVGNGAYAKGTNNTYYGGQHFFAIGNGSSYVEGYYYNNGGTISSLVITKPSSSANLTVTLVGGKVQVVSVGLTFVRQFLLQTWASGAELPSLNQKYSTTGLASYWTGSEGLGIGHTSQNASAIFQVDSTIKGFLPPRMTNVQRTNIVSPAIGLMVYCTDTIAGLYIYK